MPYGIIKVDQVTFTNAGVDQTISVSGIVASISGNITATGTISGNVIRGGTTVSGATVTGTAGQFGTITGNTAGFTTVTGATITGTTLTVASGTFTGNSTAAAFIPTGSTVPTNGVYLPAANNVAISTNGQGRLFVDASGRVGVGTASPGKTLDVTGEIRCSSRFQTLGDVISSDWIYVGSSAGARGVSSDAISRALLFGINGSEVARFDTSGRLGVGTSAPGGTLEVGAVSGAVTAGDLTVTTGSTTATVTIGRLSSTGSDNTIFNIRNRVGTSALYMNSGDGRLGIGTASPGFLVDCIGSSTPTLRIDDGAGSGTRTAGRLLLGTSTSLGVAIENSVSSFNDVCSMVFKTTPAAGTITERARIDSAGRLLVGTSSTYGVSGGDHLFNVTSTGSRTASFSRWSASSAGALLSLGKSRSSTVGSYSIASNNDELGLISFCGDDGTDLNTPAASIGAFVDGTPGADDMPGRLVFSTTADGASSPTERMRIANTGKLDAYSTGADTFIAHSSSAAGTTNYLVRGAHSATGTADGTISFQVFTNGNTQNTNNSYAGISDIKLKENIVDAASQWSDIKALQVRKYNFKEGQTHTQIGLVAQEVELVSPGLVTESPDRDAEGNDLGTVTKSVNYSVLYMKAVKALQEAMERIEQLETEMAAVKAQLA